MAITSPATAQDLNPSDTGDYAILQAHQCNSAMAKAGYAADAVARCQQVYTTLTAEENAASGLSAVNSNKLLVGQGLAMSAYLTGWSKLDGGKITRRICSEVPTFGKIVAGYRPSLTPQWDNMLAGYREVLVSLQGKC